MRSKEDPGPAAPRVCPSDEPESLATALRLFGSVFQREADAALLEEICARREGLCAALGADPLDGLNLDDPAAALETLAVEYCRLFVGPRGHLPPVESVVLGDGRFWGPATRKVVTAYRTAGIALREESREFPDHLSMELDCVAILLEDGRRDEAARFVRAHLLQWLPRLIEHVGSNAAVAFYRVWLGGLGDLLTELADAGHVTELDKDVP